MFHLKKNRKLTWSYDKQLYKHRNIIERYFLRLKLFRKVFTRYDKLNSIFIFTISLAFIFELLFM
ncbi:MAG: transposase [Firmicutes bacterium]|nr:transposase [Bacillota bacterium]